jgi:hypothetical protein
MKWATNYSTHYIDAARSGQIENVGARVRSPVPGKLRSAVKLAQLSNCLRGGVLDNFQV